MAAIWAAFGEPATARGRMAAATSVATEPSGPMESCLDDPMRAYATTGSRRA